MRPTQFCLLRCTERKPQLIMDGHPLNHKVHTTRDKPMWLPQPKLRDSRPVLRNKGLYEKKNYGIVLNIHVWWYSIKKKIVTYICITFKSCFRFYKQMQNHFQTRDSNSVFVFLSFRNANMKKKRNCDTIVTVFHILCWFWACFWFCKEGIQTVSQWCMAPFCTMVWCSIYWNTLEILDWI